MGYTLKIGEAEFEWDEYGVSVDVRGEKHNNAPAFGEPTDHENERWPSYTTWSDFCRKLRITNLMFSDGLSSNQEGEEGWDLIPLINEHPGHTPITKEHLDIIKEKYKKYKEKYPTHIAQYPPVLEGFEDKGILTPESHRSADPKYDGTLCRAEWLIYWMEWALENCEKPVFVNY